MLCFHSDFPNGATMYLVANSYVPYSVKWQELLERQIQRKLNTIDAIVLGQFNMGYPGSTFFTNMLTMTKDLPASYEIDFLNSDGPFVENVTAVFDGPLVYASMFAVTMKEKAHHNLVVAREMKRNGRQNILPEYSRRYTERLKWEGAARNHWTVADCVDFVEGNPAPSRSHRCVGKQGGIPDIVAWDLVEFFHETM